jgi:hypothetical protein
VGAPGQNEIIMEYYSAIKINEVLKKKINEVLMHSILDKS